LIGFVVFGPTLDLSRRAATVRSPAEIVAKGPRKVTALENEPLRLKITKAHRFPQKHVTSKLCPLFLNCHVT
jgi:hypothetical protein